MAGIDEFLQQVLADQREWEADPSPQTPVYALLAAGKLEEAEAVAREAVSDLEKGNVVLAKNAAVVHPERLQRARVQPCPNRIQPQRRAPNQLFWLKL